MKPDFETNVYNTIIEALKANAKHNRHGYWTDGDAIYCKTGEQAETIANILEDCGCDVMITSLLDVSANCWAVYPN